MPDIIQSVYQEMKNPLICEQTLYRFFLNSKDLSCVWEGHALSHLTGFFIQHPTNYV